MTIATTSPQQPEVHYYAAGGEGPNSPFDFNIHRMDSHGGWIASALDQGLFMAALFSPYDNEQNEPILNKSSLELMLCSSFASISGSPSPYACGLSVNASGNAFHMGSLPGTTSLQVHTKSGISWCALLNTRNDQTDINSALDALMWKMALSVPSWKVDG